MGARGLASAVGRLGSGGPCVGFVADAAGFHLAFAPSADGLAVSRVRGLKRTNELLAASIAYFEEALDPPPPELEATQADLAAVLAWMAKVEADAGRRRLLREALDAIDDGLAADAVVARLSEARRGSPSTNAQADVVDLLSRRFSELVGLAADSAAPSV
jgi:hypothetical protein